MCASSTSPTVPSWLVAAGEELACFARWQPLPMWQMKVLLETQTRESAQMIAALHTVGEDARARVEENARLRLLCQTLGATKAQLDRARGSVSDGTADGVAFSRRAYLTGSSALTGATQSHLANQAFASARMGVLLPSTAPYCWDAPEVPARVRASARSFEQDSSPRSSPTRRAAGYGSPLRDQMSKQPPLDSHVSLQEKLRAIRSKFADARESLEQVDPTAHCSPFIIARSRMLLLPLATRHSPLATRSSALATRHSLLATRHSPLATRHPDARHPTLDTRHSPITKHYISLLPRTTQTSTIRNLPNTTGHLAFATYHSPPTTHPVPLSPFHSPTALHLSSRS